MAFIIIGFIVFPLLCGFIAVQIFDFFVKPEKKDTFIDKSVHHHYYDNRSISINGNEIPVNRDESTINR